MRIFKKTLSIIYSLTRCIIFIGDKKSFAPNAKYFQFFNQFGEEKKIKSCFTLTVIQTAFILCRLNHPSNIAKFGENARKFE